MSFAGADTFDWAMQYKGENIMFRVPRNIRYNDNVVVREDEYAIFFRDGKALHVFDRPGRYALTTQNVPILARLIRGVSGVQQVGAIYYLQKREMRGKFGTKEALTFRDDDFGLVRIRVFGQFSYKVHDPLLLITQFVGTKGYGHSQEVIDWMRDQIIMNINDILGELKRDKKMNVADMPAYLEEIEQMVLARAKDEGARYGIGIMKVIGININLPREVQEAVDARASMGVLGTSYMEYQTAQAIRDLPNAGGGGAAGGTAAAGMGLGAGMGMGMMVPGMIQGGQGQGAPMVPSQAVKCPKCGNQMAADAKFCRQCGAPVEAAPATGGTACPKCGKPQPAGTKFCNDCGTKIGADNVTCPKCSAELPAGTKFCGQCGTSLGG